MLLPPPPQKKLVCLKFSSSSHLRLRFERILYLTNYFSRRLESLQLSFLEQDRDSEINLTFEKWLYASCHIPLIWFKKVTYLTLMYKTAFLLYNAFILSSCLLNNYDLRNWNVRFWCMDTKNMLFYDILWDLRCSGGKYTVSPTQCVYTVNWPFLSVIVWDIATK
jgi:hypothetical protein